MPPTIAVPVRYTQVKELPSHYLNLSYLNSLKAFGFDYLLLSPGCSLSFYEQAASVCGGLLLAGGRDIHPHVYGQELLTDTVPAFPDTDELDFLCLRLFSRLKKPVLGICRGLQVINTGFGGTLHQHLPLWSPMIDHKQTDRRSQGVHSVCWKHTIPGLCTAGDQVFVNSLHHQGIDRTAPGFQVLAESPDGLAEAIYRENILGVQWHPEEMIGPEQERIFSYFRSMMSSRRIRA